METPLLWGNQVKTDIQMENSKFLISSSDELMPRARKESWLYLMLIVTVDFFSFYVRKGLGGEKL